MNTRIIGDAVPVSDVPSVPARVVDEQAETRAEERGGRPGLDPTRYGDWEKNGRCIDF